MALEWEMRRVFVWDSGTRVDRNVLMRQGQALSVSLRRTLYGRSFSLNSLFVPPWSFEILERDFLFDIEERRVCVRYVS